MASGGISAHGTLFRVGDQTIPESSNVTWTTVADVKDISGPTETNTFIDITNHSSTHVERLASLNDPGSVTIELSFQPDDATHGSGSSGLIGLLRGQTKRAFRIVWSSTGPDVTEFNGIPASFDVSAPSADELSATCEVQITDNLTSSTST